MERERERDGPFAPRRSLALNLSARSAQVEKSPERYLGERAKILTDLKFYTGCSPCARECVNNAPAKKIGLLFMQSFDCAGPIVSWPSSK